MARQVDPEEAAKILGLIGQHPEGLTVEQIEAAVAGPRRTLQRASSAATPPAKTSARRR